MDEQRSPGSSRREGKYLILNGKAAIHMTGTAPLGLPHRHERTGISMRVFAREYVGVYSAIGCELKPRDGCPESEIADAEARLGIRVPKSLRDYYLVAGRERRLNQAQFRFLLPDGWFVDRGRLAFLEENQCVVYWGVRAGPG